MLIDLSVIKRSRCDRSGMIVDGLDCCSILSNSGLWFVYWPVRVLAHSICLAFVYSYLWESNRWDENRSSSYTCCAFSQSSIDWSWKWLSWFFTVVVIVTATLPGHSLVIGDNFKLEYCVICVIYLFVQSGHSTCILSCTLYCKTFVVTHVY